MTCLFLPWLLRPEVFSVVTGADASALQSVCKELSVFAEVTVEKEVEVICVQETAGRKGEMSEKVW